MSIQSGQTGRADDFINQSERQSTRTSDAGRSVKLEDDGYLHPGWSRSLFGNGSDGALAISSGLTTLDAGNAEVLLRQYTSLSITSTASLTISNPSTNGTLLVLQVLGDVTITSTANPAIDMSGKGAAGGAAISSPAADGLAGQDGFSWGGVPIIGGGRGDGSASNSSGGGGGAGATDGTSAPDNSSQAGGTGGTGLKNLGIFNSNDIAFLDRVFRWLIGAGGGSGGHDSGGASGAGGRGGGALLILCGGNINITSHLHAKGQDGGAASGLGDNGGGGAGGGGSIGIYFAGTVTANSGDRLVTGGVGGAKTASGGPGGQGGVGFYISARI